MPLLKNSSELNISHPIFLIGFMGCGKTTMGKRIARKAGIPFVDLDQKIVEETGMSITDFFAINGENVFRQTETQMLRTISNTEANVISTGGGTPCFNDNIEWMNENGTTVYLKLPPRALLKRLSGKEGTSRPLLKGKNEEQILDFIIMKLSEREKFYEQANLIIDVQNMNPKLVLDLLITKLQSK